MSAEKRKTGVVLGIVKGVALAPAVVAAGVVIFVTCNLILLPVLALASAVRMLLDGAFRREVLGEAWAGEGEVYYHPTHTWARLDTARVTVGPDAFTTGLVGRRANGISCASVGTRLKAGEPLWSLRCGDRVLDQMAPVAGTVTEVNTRLLRDPSLLGRTPSSDLWVVKIRPSAPVRDFKEMFGGEVIERWNTELRDRLVAKCCQQLGLVAADGGEVLPDLAERLTDAEWKDLVAREFK